jgi:TonB family protein
VTVVAVMREQSAPIAASADDAPSVASGSFAAAPNELAEQADSPPTPPSGDGVTAVELVETALNLAPIVRRPPDYPPTALARGVEGEVRLKFDVTAAGSVANVSVVESSDVQFEEAALLSVSEWRYLPRIVAGKRVGTEGVQTLIRFALGREPAVANARLERERADARRESLAFSAGLEVALDRLAADDLRGAELQLDEMQALFGVERFDLWSFYGYLYTVQADYGRAIAAYETAVAISVRTGSAPVGASVPLANLDFARHQYDLALKTLTAYRERIAAVQAQNPGRPFRPLEDDAVRLFERLQALGVTEGGL